MSALSVQGCAWDHTDECVEAIAEHGDLLMEEAENVAGTQGAPEVSCDDTGGPPAYAVFDLQPSGEKGFDDLLAREGWVCSEKTDVEDLPGMACTKAGEGVALELSTAEFTNGPVGVWVYADPSEVFSPHCVTGR